MKKNAKADAYILLILTSTTSERAHLAQAWLRFCTATKNLLEDNICQGSEKPPLKVEQGSAKDNILHGHRVKKGILSGKKALSSDLRSGPVKGEN